MLKKNDTVQEQEQMVHYSSIWHQYDKKLESKFTEMQKAQTLKFMRLNFGHMHKCFIKGNR